ncbi:S41 family peptidase [Flammeovirga sp. EKP202]|uniref:S41 family peptidase n=1 Tax=Flammeovirga sp. EKP202 TaxID=2770592 RepID=UPI00165F7912|nr:S41 family peptidase [Flammeovirga sp. EKP202]MBD0404505.1 PD40 domain-containing protein [Flammeovirga sp. EKP202]
MKRLFSFALICLLGLSTFAQSPLWMRYPSISPDGSKIAFSYQGDLYVVPTDGGKAQAITHHVAHDFSPVWSPDSKQIAFASDRFGNFDVFVMNAEGGAPQRLTYHSNKEIPSSFTPDGKAVLYTATILDDQKSAQFPYARLPELYSIAVKGGRPEQILSTSAVNATYSKDQKTILYQDVKGYEDNWRKHHTSSVTRDIWVYDVASNKHQQISTFKGEDQYPQFYKDNQTIVYLSEEEGSFNIWTTKLDGSNKERLTSFDKHPIRFLTVAEDGKMCFGYDGEIYTFVKGEKPQKVKIEILNDSKVNNVTFERKSSGGNQIAVSPNGKEMAFILRGDVFVTSVDYNTTVQITKTPEQERSVSFSPDGRKLVYAGERNDSWNIYTSEIENEEDLYFVSASSFVEKVVTDKAEEEFQPMWSPKGDEIAFLEERTTLKVINLDTKKERVILPGTYNYSYSDGDQAYDWSPDGKWFVVQYSPNQWTSSDIALVDAKGDQNIINLTESGYNSGQPKFAMDGKAIIFSNDRYGFRSHGSWGAEDDVFAIFLTKEAYDEFQLSKEEFELLEEARKEAKKKEKEDKEDDSKKKKKKEDDKKEDDKEEALVIDFDGLKDRILRLTINSSFTSDMLLTKDGSKLFYMSRFEGGYDLWSKDIRKNETKLVLKLSGYGGNLQFDKDHKNIFFVTNGKFAKMDVKSNKRKSISYAASYYLDHAAEREYMFDHVWRQVKKKFYDSNIHGLDWAYYKTSYAKFLPYISNNYDYSEMLSEMLGELNGSHTGCRYYASSRNGDQTANLGAFYNPEYQNDGLEILEVIEGSPLTKIDEEVKAGMIITEIDGQKIVAGQDYFQLLNHKRGTSTYLTILDPTKNKVIKTEVKPISQGALSNLLYKRWVKQREKETEEASNGKIGYVHVRGMNSSSFRTVYSEALGKNYNKEALIVDTRFNGGGWLHDDLVTFLSGKVYAQFAPNNQKFGTEPINKWTKPSAVLASEGNYSDAHAFPYAYKTLGIGKIIGMPVPGTMTAVWWERLQDPSLVFGIPQVGVKDMNGNFLENQQIEPDVKIAQDKDVVVEGVDQQLRKAVEELMK